MGIAPGAPPGGLSEPGRPMIKSQLVQRIAAKTSDLSQRDIEKIVNIILAIAAGGLGTTPSDLPVQRSQAYAPSG